MEKFVEYLIYFYMFICFTVLLYNLGYIFTQGRKDRIKTRRTEKWKKDVKIQLFQSNKKDFNWSLHNTILERRLKNFNVLIAYNEAMDEIEQEFSEKRIRSYYKNCYMAFQALAFYYSSRDSMERAYFAYLISRYQPCTGEKLKPIMEYLISYLENSTIYCRENVLNALYTLGNSLAVEQALQIIHDRNLFHHQKLLSDGLMKFTGDKLELTRRLWRHYGEWSENMMLGVVQFITSCTDKFSEEFLEVLEDKNASLEIRIAILRYYRRHPFDKAYETIIRILDEGQSENGTLAIVAASVLSQYPRKKTIFALEQALNSRNWYIRYNAASSLMALNISEEEKNKILNGDDRYAREIVQYMYRLEKEEKTG